MKATSELIGNEAARSVTITVKLKLPANVCDAFKEAGKLGRELNRRWAPEEAAARWLSQHTIAALQELRAEEAARDREAAPQSARACV